MMKTTLGKHRNLRAAVLDDARWGPSPLRRCQLQLCYMVRALPLIQWISRPNETKLVETGKS